MKSSRKLDTLQEMVKEYAGDPNRLYLIGLLVEHADEEEITEEFLKWIRVMLDK